MSIKSNIRREKDNEAKVVLKKIIGSKFNVTGAVTQLGLMSCDKSNWKDSEIKKNPFFCPDKKSVKLWEKYLLAVRKAGSSCGAIIELRATGVPVGLGAPIYSKLDTDIAAALMSINAVKGVNIGAGMNAAFLSGEENSDEMSKGSGKIKFKSLIIFLTCFFVSVLNSYKGSLTSALHLPIKERAYLAGVGLGSANNIFDNGANFKFTLSNSL